jgi:hypothetical protein
MSEVKQEKVRLPTHINVKKTKAVIETIQVPVRKVISKKVVTQTIVPGKFKTVIPASTTKEINHQIVQYGELKYIVGYCPFKDKDILFVTDYQSPEFYKNLVTKAWHYRSDGGYIASGVIGEDDNRKELYLHNFVMDKLTFNGKGQHHTIDHINRNGRDNRKVNLRELTQSHQNINQSKRTRIIELPDGCGIDPNDIPKNIYYKPAFGAHGDLFYIEIRTPEIVQILCPKEQDNDLVGSKTRYRWNGTKTKTVDLRVKLQHAINKLQELKIAHPQIAHLIGEIDNIEESNNLAQSFNEIIELTTYPQDIKDANKVELITPHNPIPINQVQAELAVQIQEQTIRGLKSHLPEGCGVTPQMIPKYCYYKPAGEARGDKFIIERHPGLTAEGKRQWTTTESKKFTTKQKFDFMMEKLNELEHINKFT